jgi:hypothetical protein
MKLMLRRFAVALLVLFLTTLAFGQGKKDKNPTERSVTGTVTDADGNPLPGAVVQLKNMKTLQVRSFIAKEKGDFYFQGLSTDVDYEFKAEWNGKWSNTRTLSSFDSHPTAVINLKIKP